MNVACSENRATDADGETNADGAKQQANQQGCDKLRREDYATARLEEQGGWIVP